MSAYSIHPDEQRRSNIHLHESAYHFAYFVCAQRNLSGRPLPFNVWKCIMCFSIKQNSTENYTRFRWLAESTKYSSQKTRQFLFLYETNCLLIVSGCRCSHNITTPGRREPEHIIFVEQAQCAASYSRCSHRWQRCDRIDGINSDSLLSNLLYSACDCNRHCRMSNTFTHRPHRP